ncbi:hypothetical protein [Sphingomonas sp. 67-41]|uniref:beta strand repeat-containing protein n=1 Tax=Sphingomonas TaxID=13687 RepID=UPI00096111D4|nr:hypothetical protein [Sphingomonas sp. 67-41]OJY48568.1 MAG: hypothetical protein BGP17_13105 [Sphingomonas sp. 67-41]
MSRITHSRTALMIGGATVALAAMLAVTPASAQSTDQVSGTRVVADHQRADHVRALADTSGFEIVMAAPPAQGSDIALRANGVTASVRANRSDSEFSIDSAELVGQRAVTRLTSGNRAVAADGDALLVTTQRGASSIATALSTGGTLGINIDTSRGNSVAVAENRLDAQALGNDAMATLSLEGLQQPAAGGIVGFQSNDTRSAVTSTNMAAVRIGTGATFGSDLAMTDNLVRALGYGNAFSSDFTVTGASAFGSADGGPVSLVPGSADGDPTISATFATLSHQEQDGAVTARAGENDGSDPFHLVVFGSLSDSAVRHDGDALVAGGYGNQSDNAMSLRVGAVSGSGAVANLTAVQRAGAADVEADTVGGIRTNILGAMTASQASLSDNSARAVAIANLAERNQLTVEASTVDTFGLPGSGPVGTASAGFDNSSSVTAAFSVHNVQDFGESSVGATSTSALKLGVLSPVERSTLAADGNTVSVAATGNGATNGLTLSAPLLRASADLNNVQSGNGQIRVEAGGGAAPLGVLLALPATVLQSDLAVRDNVLAGTAIGNSASNSMSVAGTSFANGSGHGEAVSGPLLEGYGAAADYALASTQKLGLSGSVEDAVGINSAVAGRFGMLGDYRTYGSAYSVEGNGVASTIIGNTVANRLSLSAVSLGSADTPAPGTALSSAQYGQVIGTAQSTQALVAPGSLDGSSVSVKANTNQAYAGINEADNRLAVAAVDAGSLTGRNTRVSIVSSPGISGDDVLGNLQFAGGSISADGVTSIENGDSGIGMAGSRFAINANVTAAEANANRAVNLVTIDTLGGGVAGGLGNMQTSTASVAANASLDAGYRASQFPAMPMIDASSVGIDGNATSALARGNAVDNQLVVRGNVPSPVTVTSEVSRFEIWADAGAPLLNAQTNYGSVTASASNSLVGAAFNGPLTGMNQASMTIGANTVSAAAYGNTATNAASLSSFGQPGSVAIVSSQTNYGPVTAIATGNQLILPLGSMTGSSFALTGNQVSAVAVGNQATNSITSLR